LGSFSARARRWGATQCIDMAAIFVSYSHLDKKFAEQVKAWLAAQKYEQVFLDADPNTGIPVGDDWEQTLYANVSRCHVMILLLSPNWYASNWCFVELSFAKALGKRLMPIVYKPITDQPILPHIQAKILPDFEAGDIRDWNKALDDVAKRLQFITSQLARGFRFDPNRSAYPGIQAFEAEDAAIYFGRDQEILSVIERLEARRRQGDTRYLIIIGASGSGKSSLLKAGVLPQLPRRTKSWIVLPVMRPGKAPIEAFAKSIAYHLNQPADWEKWRDKLSDPAKAVAEFETLLKSLRVGDAAAATVLLPMDQLEELFKVSPEPERLAFLRLLADLTDKNAKLPIMVVATGRSEVLEPLSAYVVDRLLKAKQLDDPSGDRTQDLSRMYDTYMLAPMPLSRIKDLVEGPAGVVGMIVEDGLAQHIAKDVNDLNALPVLALTLWQLYRLCKAKNLTRMTIVDYDSLGDAKAGLNPIENAVKRVVAQALGGLDPIATDSEMAALRDAFVPHMVRLQTESGEPLRQSARRSELPAESLRLIDALRDASLLTERVADAQAEGATDTIVEVTHEALFKAWTVLDQWINDDRSFLLDLERVRQAHDVWTQVIDDAAPATSPRSWIGRLRNWLRDALGLTSRRGKAAALLRGLLLSRAQAWLQKYPQRFYGLASIREFIEASVKAEEAERLKREQSLRLLLKVASIAAAVFLVLFILAGVEFKIATAVSDEAQRTESEFLARDARAAVANGNIALGLQLAMLALPGDINHPNRPFVAEAEYALEEAFANHRAVDTLDSRDTLNSRDGGIWSAVYSNDGKLVATVADDGIVKVLNAATHATVATLRHEAPVTAAAFSPDGRWIATASRDKSGRIWNVEQSNSTISLIGHTGMLTSIAFSPDGHSVLTASTDKIARLWNAANGGLIREYTHQGVVWSAAFSAKGDRVVTTSWEGTVKADPPVSFKGAVRVWKTDGDTPILTIPAPPIPSRLGESWMLDAQFSPVGLCTLEDGTAGTCIVTAGTDNTARIWNADNGVLVGTLSGHQDWVNSAAFSSDGKVVVTASLDKTIRLWSVAAKASVAILTGHHAAVDSAMLSHNGEQILSASEDHTARIWNTNTDDLKTVLEPRQKWVVAAAFSSDRVVTAENVGGNSPGATGEVRLWDLIKPGESTVVARYDTLMRFVAASPDGRRIITASDDTTAELLDAATMTRIKLFKHDKGVWFAGFSRDSKYVATTSGDQTFLWTAVDGAPWTTLGGLAEGRKTGHTAQVASADFAPGDRYVVTVSWDHTGLIWDTADPAASPLKLEESARFTSVVYSPGGAHVAGAADDGFVRIWDAKTGKLVRKLPVHDSLYSVAYSSDGKYLLTASKDRTARLWNAQTGAEIVALRGHSDDVRFAAFSSDDKRVVTASQDGTSRVWELPPRCEELLKGAKAMNLPPLTEEEKAQYFQNEKRNAWAPMLAAWAPMLAGSGRHCN
jgi:WD40 repeat protein